MKSFNILMVVLATWLATAEGAASICEDPLCSMTFDTSCAEWFELNFVFPDSPCCSFREIDGPTCVLETTSSCQFDSKEKHDQVLACLAAQPEEGCSMVGPTMLEAMGGLECPESQIDIPDTSLWNTQGDPTWWMTVQSHQEPSLEPIALGDESETDESSTTIALLSSGTLGTVISSIFLF